jgi:hypothetical protein
MPYPAEYGYLPGAAYHTYDEIGESTSYAMPSALAEVHATHSLLTSSASVLSILDECNAEDVSEGLPPEQEMAL